MHTDYNTISIPELQLVYIISSTCHQSCYLLSRIPFPAAPEKLVHFKSAPIIFSGNSYCIYLFLILGLPIMLPKICVKYALLQLYQNYGLRLDCSIRVAIPCLLHCLDNMSIFLVMQQTKSQHICIQKLSNYSGIFSNAFYSLLFPELCLDNSYPQLGTCSMLENNKLRLAIASSLLFMSTFALSLPLSLKYHQKCCVLSVFLYYSFIKAITGPFRFYIMVF